MKVKTLFTIKELHGEKKVLKLFSHYFRLALAIG